MKLYADETVRYGRIVEVLSIGAENNLKMVLATQPVSNPRSHAADPADTATDPATVTETLPATDNVQ